MLEKHPVSASSVNILKNSQLFHQQKGTFSYAEPGFPEELITKKYLQSNTFSRTQESS